MSLPPPPPRPPATAGGRPQVTLFVMAYNQERFVREAVEAAFAQTFSPLEIVLSDDGSSDGTFEIMQEMAAAYDGPHSIVLNRNEPNLGIVPHIDRIVEISSGDLLVQSGGDDISAPDRVETLAAAWFASGRKARVLHSPVMEMSGTGEEIGLKLPVEIVDERVGPLAYVERNMYVIGAAQAFARELYDRFGPLGGVAALEDRPMPFRALLLGKVAWIDRPLLRYRVGGVSDQKRRITGREQLYGVRLRYHRWFAASYRCYLLDLEKASIPHETAEAIRRICKEREPISRIYVDLADADFVGRLRLLPRAARLSRERGDRRYVMAALKYLFSKPYLAYWRMRYGADEG